MDVYVTLLLQLLLTKHLQGDIKSKKEQKQPSFHFFNVDSLFLLPQSLDLILKYLKYSAFLMKCTGFTTSLFIAHVI